MIKKRYAMLADTRRCVGCQACTLACKAENKSPEAGFRNWIETETTGEFPHLHMEIRSLRCQHCDNAPCVSACPTGASHIGEGGTALVEKDKCTGCKACIAACPYDARYVHSEGYIDKCTFCLHRVRQGKDPACVAVCPTLALTFGDLANPEKELAKQLGRRKYRVLKPEAGTEPHLFLLI